MASNLCYQTKIKVFDIKFGLKNFSTRIRPTVALIFLLDGSDSFDKGF